MGAYPEVTSSVAGTMVLQEYAGAVHVHGFVTGLEASATGGWHIHAGFSCATPGEVLGHFFDEGTSDPWNAANGATYETDVNGVAEVTLTMPGFYRADVMK